MGGALGGTGRGALSQGLCTRFRAHPDSTAQPAAPTIPLVCCLPCMCIHAPAHLQRARSLLALAPCSAHGSSRLGIAACARMPLVGPPYYPPARPLDPLPLPLALLIITAALKPFVPTQAPSPIPTRSLHSSLSLLFPSVVVFMYVLSNMYVDAFGFWCLQIGMQSTQTGCAGRAVMLALSRVQSL